jgi:hypothetical protein
MSKRAESVLCCLSWCTVKVRVPHAEHKIFADGLWWACCSAAHLQEFRLTELPQVTGK